MTVLCNYKAFLYLNIPKPVECGKWDSKPAFIMTGNGLCMDAEDGRQGGSVTVEPCNYQRSRAQQWSIYSPGLQIRHSDSGLCLDVFRVSTADQAPLGLWPCNRGSNQNFTRSAAWTLQPSHSKKCIQPIAASGSSSPSPSQQQMLVQMPCDAKQEGQRWFRPNYLPWPCNGTLGSCANQ